MIALLCNQAQLSREWLGYYRAFAKREPVVCWGLPVNGSPGWRANSPVQELLATCSEPPRLILHPDGSNILPRELEKVGIPTACFHIDVYAYTRRRIRWAMLFDYVFLFHPGFVRAFTEAGHPRALAHPHAVDPEPFERCAPRERIYEVGWVGRIQGPLYATRSRVVPAVARTFKMNPWQRTYPYKEMVEVYASSKIGLNISGDNYPAAANLRVLEVMAAGALLVTPLPSELADIGFREGEHFVGYRKESELADVLRHYLERNAERERIAAAGRNLVLREHTYDRRAEEILNFLHQDRGELFAPARSWPESRVRQTYVDYYCAAGALNCAVEELWRIGPLRSAAAWKSLPLLLGGLRRSLRAGV